MGLKLHDRTKLVMEYASEEATKMRAVSISGRHVVVAIVKEGTGVAAIELIKQGHTNLDHLRTIVAKVAERLWFPTPGQERILSLDGNVRMAMGGGSFCESEE